MCFHLRFFPFEIYFLPGLFLQNFFKVHFSILASKESFSQLVANGTCICWPVGMRVNVDFISCYKINFRMWFKLGLQFGAVCGEIFKIC